MANARIRWDIDPIRQCQKLKAGLRNRVLRISASKGGGVIKRAVESAAPKGQTGGLSKSIRVRLKVYGGTAVAVVGPSLGYKRKGPKIKTGKNAGTRPDVRPARWAHIIQFGGANHPADPFLTRGLASSQSAAVAAAGQKAGEMIEQILSR